MSTLSRRFAKAVAGIATDAAALEQVITALEQAAALVKENRELAVILSSPAVEKSQRDNLISAIGKKAQWPETAVNTLKVLADHRGMAALPELTRELDLLADQRLGRVSAEVTTAVPLDEAGRRKVEQGIGKLTGKKVRLRVQMDPKLLGGAVTRIGSVLYDGSVARQIALLRDSIAAG